MEGNSVSEPCKKKRKTEKDTPNEEGGDGNLTFPLEVWYLIGLKCEPKTLGRLSMTCSSLHRLLDDERLWEKIFASLRIKKVALISPPSTRSLWSWKWCCHAIKNQSDSLSEIWETLNGGERIYLAPGVYDDCLETHWSKDEQVSLPIEIIGEGQPAIVPPFDSTYVLPYLDADNDDEEEEEGEGKRKQKKELPPPTRVIFAGGETATFVLNEPVIFHNICFCGDKAEKEIAIELCETSVSVENCFFRTGLAIFATSGRRITTSLCHFECYRGIVLDGPDDEGACELYIEGCVFDKTDGAVDSNYNDANIRVMNSQINAAEDYGIQITNANKLLVCKTSITKAYRAIELGAEFEDKEAMVIGCTFKSNPFETFFCYSPKNNVVVRNTTIDSTGGLTVGGFKEGCIFSTNPGEENDIQEDKGVGPVCMDAVNRKKCTFTATGEKFYPQYWWRCLTCNYEDETGVCATCYELCHKGHQMDAKWNRSTTTAEGEIVKANFSLFYCDCGWTHSDTCKAL